MRSLCTALRSHPVLALSDFTKAFSIKSDTSDTAAGGVCKQEYASIPKHIAFLSKTLTRSKQNYSVHDHKQLEFNTYCKSWGPYIDMMCHTDLESNLNKHTAWSL